MSDSQSSCPKVIDSILALSKELLDLMEKKLGAPPPLSYLSTGYIGPNKFTSDTTDIETNLLRARAIIRHSPTKVIKSKERKTKTYYGGRLTEEKINAIKMSTKPPPATPKPSTHGKTYQSSAQQ